MKVNKNTLIILSLFSMLARGESLENKIQAGIDGIKAIERNTVYDRTLVHNRPSSTHVKTNEKLNVTYNADTDGGRSYVVFSNGEPDSVKLVNNAVLGSGAEVFAGQHGPYYKGFVYFENNNTINGYAPNVEGVNINAKNVYIKNSKIGDRKSVIKGSLDVYSTIIALENEGEIFHTINLTANKVFVINKEDAKLHNTYLNGYNNENLEKSEINLINKGEINYLGADYATNIEITNDKLINKLSINNDDYYSADFNKANVKFLNTENGFIKTEIFRIETNKLDFENRGIIGSEIVDDGEYYYNNRDISIVANTGKVVNKNTINTNLEINSETIGDYIDLKSVIDEERKTYPDLEVHLEDGELKGNLYLKRKDVNGTIVSVKSEKNITGYISGSEGDNDTLVLLGEGKKEDQFFYGIEKLHLKDSDWSFGSVYDDIRDEIILDNSKLTIDRGRLDSKKTEIGENSTLKITSRLSMTTEIKNSGTIQLENNPKDATSLEITGNYVGDNGKILMRALIDNEPSEYYNTSDKIYISGNASGNTGVEISNPGSTLSKRWKDRLEMISTGSSTPDAFTLLNPIHGAYRYKWYLENNNWYLEQEFVKPTDDLGIILNSMEKGQHEFNLTYYDHDRETYKEGQELWTKVTNMTSKNVLSDRDNINIPIKSNLTSVFLGYDLGVKKEEKNVYKYGIYGNLGMDNVKSGETKVSGISGAFGLGIYGTWRNDNWYADGWLNYTYMQNRINTEVPINFGVNVFKASAELGTDGNMYLGNMRLHAKHYAQFIYSYILTPKLEQTKDIEYLGNSNLRTKLGTNLTLHTGKKYLNPFIDFNWNYDVNLVGVKVDDINYYLDGNKNMLELKWGLKDIEINDRLNMWANAVHCFGERGYRANGVQLGMLYKY